MTTAIFDRSAAIADVFRLLSACYYQLEKNVLFEEDLFGQLRIALELCLPEQATQADALATALQAAPDQDLLVDYSKLFVGPDTLLAPPYGSVYLDHQKTLMGDSTMDAISRYHDADFDVSDDFKNAPDHITVELEFLYLLTYKESLALVEERLDDHSHWQQQRQSFVNEHIGCWIETFCDNVRKNTHFDYYRCLADLTEKFIRSQKPAV